MKFSHIYSATAYFCVAASCFAQEIKVGWIGAMSGPIASYGAYNAAQVAVEEINANGGINGRKFTLVAEDGRCDSRTAVSAAQKLINIDHVKYILGGHCSPESIPIAPMAEKSKVIMLAAITSSPKLTNAGDYVFRITPVSLTLATLLAPHAYKTRGIHRIAILHEETDYCVPVAEEFRTIFSSLGGEVVDFESFSRGETDFRSVLTKIKSKNPAGIYIGIQAQDTADILVRQMRELGINVPLYGNEIVGNAASRNPALTDLYRGLVYAEPEFDRQAPRAAQFIEKYKKRFSVSELPMGVWTAEAYDSVILLADVLRRCGEEVEKVKQCLYQIRDYHGAAGSFSIDQNGDGVKKYVIKHIEK